MSVSEPGSASAPDGPSDAALVRAARHGDSGAFTQLVTRHGPAMYRFAVRLLGDENDAAEAVQDALVSAWRDLDSFRGDAALRTWLFTLTSRRAVDLQRKRRPTPVDDEVLARLAPARADEPFQNVLDDDLVQALKAALAELPWQARAVWLLREIEGLSYADIAAALSTTPGAVRGHLARSRPFLAERLERWR